MATDSVSTFVGTRFINQYYNVLKESPENAYRFYTDSSTITLLDGSDTHTASNLADIHSLLTSLQVAEVEVKSLNCQNSLNGGVLLIVSGSLRFINFTGKRNFTQFFFLAPQDTGYFVLNDILKLNDEISVTQKSVFQIPEINVNPEFHAPSPHLEQRASGYEQVEDTREYVNSINVEEDSLVDKYSLSDEQQHEESQPQTVVKEASMEPPSLESSVHHVNGVDDSVSVPNNNEPSKVTTKLSYAFVLKAAKTESAQPVASQRIVRQNVAPPLEQHQRIQTSAPQLSLSASLLGPQKVNFGADKSSAQEGELKSVYVRGLPLNVTNTDLQKVFMKFGKIKPNGVFIKNRKEIGVCFAFVEFQDMSGVHNALKASPVEVLGNEVVIEERRASSSSSTRGGATARGRGRGSYQSESRGQGQGSVLGSSDYSRFSH